MEGITITHSEATAARIKRNIIKSNYIERFIDESREEEIKRSFITTLGIKEFLKALDSELLTVEVRCIEVIRDPAGYVIFINTVNGKDEEYKIRSISAEYYKMREAKKYMFPLGGDIA